jgi:hypothetical protein
MKKGNKNDALAKKAYVKPAVVKHATATQIVGSSSNCSAYVSTNVCYSSPYYH